MEARSYQVKADTAIYAKWKEFRRILLPLATGTGKTFIFSNVAAKELAGGHRPLILCHRDELIRQACDKLQKATGLVASVEKAEQEARPGTIVVGSVQTLMRQSRLEKFPFDHFDRIFIDEAHHCLSASWQKVLARFPNAKVAGFTATPERGDRKNLGRYFEDVAFEYGIKQAVAEGYLCHIVIKNSPIKIDVSNVGITNGDFDKDETANALDPYLPEIAKTIPLDRKTLIFTPLCATSKKLQEILRSIGRRAYYASGDDRSQVPAWEQDGLGSIMLNSQLFSEGYDHCMIDHVMVLRITKSTPFMIQMLGRGTRIWPGKKNLLVTDHLWQTSRHDICHPCNLIAESPEVAEKMQKRQEESGGPIDLFDLEVSAKRDVIREREEALARELRSQRHKESRLIDPLAYAVMIKNEALADYEPVFAWEEQAPTPGQIQLLRRFGINADKVKTKGHAKHLIDCVLNRSKMKLATPGQARTLSDAGYYTDMSKTRASEILDELSKNYWRIKF